MASAASVFVAKIAKSRDEGDITLECEGKDIMAHSFILKERFDWLHFASSERSFFRNDVLV